MKGTAYLLQAAIIGAWWLSLALSQKWFDAFQFAEIPPVAFWSFFAPDIVLIFFLSIVRGYRNVVVIEFIILGAFAYAALFCCNATFLTGSGFLPTSLMLAGLAYNVLLCFNQSLFRTSQSNSAVVNAAKTLIQVVFIWVVALACVPYVILESFGALSMPKNGYGLYSSIVLFAGFSMLGLTSAFYFVRDGQGTPLPLDQTNALVVTGPYHFVRNPMAIAGIGQGLSLAMVFQSIPILVYSLLGAVIWHFVVRPIEERDMAKRFGGAYLAYRQQVACWVPRFRQGNS